MEKANMQTTPLDAARLGERQYQGKPCAEGHSGIRYTSNSACVTCLKSAAKTRYERIKKLLVANA